MKPAVSPAVVGGIILLVLLLISLPRGVGALDLLAAVAAAAAGALAVALWPIVNRSPRREATGSEHTPRPRPTGGGTDGGSDEEPVDPDRLDADERRDAVRTLLKSLAVDLDARRIVVWQVDAEGDRITPTHTHGAPPGEIEAAGSPLAWALEDGSPIRLDPSPVWARGFTVVAPVDGDRVVSIEADDRVTVERAAWAASILGPVLTLHDRQADADAANQRFERVIEFLRTVPGEPEPQRLPDALADAGIGIAGGDGALVAAWSGEEGVVLARQGTAGGPAPGTTFGGMEGDLAHAARTGTTIQRTPEDGVRRPALAAAEERWGASPPYRVVIPLVDPGGSPRGLLAVWGSRTPSVQGVALLESLGPLLGLHLAQASDLVRFRERATTDALTGLPNRGALDERMKELGNLFDRYRRPLAVLVLDLDRFKDINDYHGHGAGDAVLKNVAEVIRSNIRDVDFVARFGGEEIVVLLPETMLRAALDVAERIRAAIESAPAEYETRAIQATVSIGVSGCPECVDEPEALITSADQALYTAKEGGRNRVASAPTRVGAGKRAAQ